MPPNMPRRFIKCKECGDEILVTQGLEAMSDHWEIAHPDKLRALRAGILRKSPPKLPNPDEGAAPEPDPGVFQYISRGNSTKH